MPVSPIAAAVTSNVALTEVESLRAEVARLRAMLNEATSVWSVCACPSCHTHLRVHVESEQSTDVCTYVCIVSSSTSLTCHTEMLIKDIRGIA